MKKKKLITDNVANVIVRVLMGELRRAETETEIDEIGKLKVIIYRCSDKIVRAEFKKID